MEIKQGLQPTNRVIVINLTRLLRLVFQTQITSTALVFLLNVTSTAETASVPSTADSTNPYRSPVWGKVLFSWLTLSCLNKFYCITDTELPKYHIQRDECRCSLVESKGQKMLWGRGEFLTHQVCVWGDTLQNFQQEDTDFPKSATRTRIFDHVQFSYIQVQGQRAFRWHSWSFTCTSRQQELRLTPDVSGVTVAWILTYISLALLLFILYIYKYKYILYLAIVTSAAMFLRFRAVDGSTGSNCWDFLFFNSFHFGATITINLFSC